MKIVTASGKQKVIMTRKEWEAIGKKAGWSVEAKAAHRPPKAWFDEKAKEVKDGNPDYSEEQINSTVGNIWYNELSDSKREEIYARHHEGKSPNK